MKLDNAAKIYPAAKRRKWNNLFRLSATLTEPVDTETLQAALDRTVLRFPSIAVRLRRGMFWYYLEEIPKAPNIQPDTAYPVARMPFDDIRQCAFRVLYYQNRIAVEFFHALTDGNGGLVFLKTLLAEYLTQKYKISVPAVQGVLDRDAPPREEEIEDSFLKYEGEISRSRKEATAFRLDGTPETDGFLNIITGILNTDEVLTEAKKRGVSLTVFIASVMILSIQQIQDRQIHRRKKQKPIKILIPVNLRNMFESSSLRNFVLFVTPGIDPRMGEYTLDEILRSIHHQMGEELTPKKMAARISANVKPEKSWWVKLPPLFVKNFLLKMVFNSIGERKSCLTLSNLGAVKVPEIMAPFLSRMDFVLGTQATRPNNCGILSYGGKLYINFIRNIKEPSLEREFFTALRKLGLHVTVESNQR